ncbi:MAG: protease modulator HflC [Magnetococcales bacterium]|nr:protease modulator HflC [Magnetococcales bacterium]
MNKINPMSVLVLGVLVLVLLSHSLFTVHQVEQALVVQLGKPVRAIKEAGLNYKIPFIQDVYTFDRRLLSFDQDPQEVLSKDKKNLKVDNYARWRIIDPLKYYQTVRNELGAASRLNDIIYSNLREVLGQYTMMEIVSGERELLMGKIQTQANKQAGQYGIEIVDVRIKRTDLPPENSKAVFRRMQTERQRQAKQYRAQGEEEGAKIRSKADKEREVILANAYETSQTLRGQGDATAAAIYADAFNRDQEFYQFLRSMEAYRNGLRKDTTVMLTPDSQFFRYFKGLHGKTER